MTTHERTPELRPVDGYDWKKAFQDTLGEKERLQSQLAEVKNELNATRRAHEAHCKMMDDELAEARRALEKLAKIGEEGMPTDYNEWLDSHTKIAQIARAALRLIGNGK